MVAQISALSPHSCACSMSGMHSCSWALSCLCFPYFDLFNRSGEGEVSGMFVHMHLNYMASCVCECM